MASRSPVAQKRDSMPAQMIERNRDSPSRFTEPKSASVRQGQKPTPDASYSFGKNNRPAGRQNQSYTQQPNSKRGMGRPQVEMSPKSRKAQNELNRKRQDEEEPICVLKVELDGGENIQHIKVYEGQLPEEIVDEFGRKFNLSERAKFRLLE